jgi:hypothetical protein
MKQSKRIIIGLVGLMLLPLGYGVFTTIQVSRLEQRVERLQASNQKLGLKLIDTMLAEASPAVAAQAKIDFLRDSLGLPPASVTETPPTATKVNALPRGLTSQ